MNTEKSIEERLALRALEEEAAVLNRRPAPSDTGRYRCELPIGLKPSASFSSMPLSLIA